MWRRTLVAVSVLAFGSALSVATLELRMDTTHNRYYGFLTWNLFLAWVPLIVAVVAYARFRQRRLDALTALLLTVWLLFFPNAPYVLTDIIHLGRQHGAPLWYDVLMLASFAATAMLLGFVSLFFVQTIAAASVGARASWLLVVAVLSLASFGVYLGRTLGFNSWDAIVHPIRVVDAIAVQVGNPVISLRLLIALFILTGLLIAGYLPIYRFSALRLRLNS
jgi:uncharacterized membrane protein